MIEYFTYETFEDYPAAVLMMIRCFDFKSRRRILVLIHSLSNSKRNRKMEKGKKKIRKGKR
jgi:hypothetical protein